MRCRRWAGTSCLLSRPRPLCIRDEAPLLQSPRVCAAESGLEGVTEFSTGGCPWGFLVQSNAGGTWSVSYAKLRKASPATQSVVAHPRVPCLNVGVTARVCSSGSGPNVRAHSDKVS